MAQNETIASSEDMLSEYGTPRSFIGTAISEDSFVGDARNTNSMSVLPQAQSLLTALENFIVPLVLGAGATRNKERQAMIGTQFLSALQTLIVTIINDSKASDPNGIEVAVEDGELDSLVDSEDSSNTSTSEMPSEPTDSIRSLPTWLLSHELLTEWKDMSSSETLLVNRRYSLPTHLVDPPHMLSKGLRIPAELVLESTLWNNRSKAEAKDITSETLCHWQPNAFARLLLALQRHVFNTMPIRLLCFEPSSETMLHISLIERGEIYERIAADLQKHKVGFLTDYNRTWTASQQQDLIDRYVQGHTRYGILSHTWIHTRPGEVTYTDWQKGPKTLLDEKPEGYQKLVNFCRISMLDYGLHFGWADMVCINKESSAELDESIRSMFHWYRNSECCITYLAKTTSMAEMASDPWFTRGWTLQELLAPLKIKFYNTNWKAFNEDRYRTDKSIPEILAQIKSATSITKEELDRVRIKRFINSIPISRKMQWAANREVTRGEDAVYSLMGIFNISMSTAYGEGSENAFMRLVKEILNTFPNVQDIFNWAGSDKPGSTASALLPRNASYYLQRSSDIHLGPLTPVKPITLTHLGLRVPILMMAGLSPSNAALDYPAIGDYYATVDLSHHEPNYHINDAAYGLYQYPHSYNLLDRRLFQPTPASLIQFQLMFGVLNFGGDKTTILLPQNCLAIGFAADLGTPVGKLNKFSTNKPIIFELHKKNSDPPSTANIEVIYYSIPKTELEKQKIQLLTIYI